MNINSVKILYDGVDIFSGIAPTPMVSMSNDYLDFKTKWNQVTTVTLEGQLTGLLGNFSYHILNSGLNRLQSGFQYNYKTLLITENNTGIFTGKNAIINSINVEENPWYGVLPFSIEFSIYDSGLFKDYYNIVEPEESFNFVEQEDRTLNLTHSLSAKGLVADNKNAIQNAKEWVLSKTGNVNTISPIFIKSDNYSSGISGILKPTRQYLLMSTNEVIDRFNGTYSWEGQYKKSLIPDTPEKALLNYTIDVSSGIENNFIMANINGDLNGNSLTILREEYNKLDLYNLCNLVCQDIFKQNLSNRPITQSIEEISEENKLTFKASYNNDYADDIINSYTVDLNEDSLKCIRTVDFKTDITCKYGDIQTKWNKVYDYYKNQFYAYPLAKEEYSKEYPSGVLYEIPKSESITFDTFNAKISYSVQYSDKRISLNTGIINLTSTVSFKPSLDTFAPHTSAFTPREHNIQNIGCMNRTVAEISVTATAKMNQNISLAETEAIYEVERSKQKYITGEYQLMEQRNITRNSNIKSVTINETWSFNGPMR